MTWLYAYLVGACAMALYVRVGLHADWTATVVGAVTWPILLATACRTAEGNFRDAYRAKFGNQR